MSDKQDRLHGERLGAQRPEAEVDDELQFHLEKRIQANVARGMSPDDARRAALDRFGDMRGVRETCAELLIAERKAEARRDWLDDLRQDLRFAFRSAVRAPLFTLLAVATLALGIGANAAVFGVVKSVLLNALPYRDAGRLMRVTSPIRAGGDARGSLSAGTISDTRERQRSFESLAAWQAPRDVVYSGETSAEVVKAMWIEPNMLATLGVSPARGGGFRDEDARRDTTNVVMLSHRVWQRLFSGDPSVIGRTIRLNGLPRTVVGILPRDFVAPESNVDFYLPLGVALFMRDPISVRGSHGFGMLGRLKPGVAPEAAVRELNGIGAELEKLYAKDNLGIGLTAQPIRDAMVGDTRAPLIVLLASAALVLLITCANLAGALLSRTISRRKEFAVRVALGAGRGRLVRQLLTESVMLSAAGGIAGIGLAMAGLAALRGLALTVLPSYADLTLDTTAVIVTFALALLTGVAFGLGPALSVGRSDPQKTLRDQTRGASESNATRRVRGLLVAGQIALCVSLLAAAGLLARSLWAMTSADPGFNANGLLTFTLQLPGAKYGTPESRVLAHDQLEQRLSAIPGVTATAAMSQLPTKVANSNGLFIQDQPWGPNEPVPFILTVRASDSYFKTLGISLRAGRTFASSDRADVPPVIVINEAMAQRYWPKGNAVGARIHIGPPNPTAPWITVIGVVSNVRNDPTHFLPEPMMFIPLRQEPYGETFVVRTPNDPASLTSAVRRAIGEVDPSVPMYDIATVQSVIADGFAPRRLPAVLMGAFGLLALLLASVGVYAMFANMAAAREREFGVRVALGSTRAAIAALVLRQGGVWMMLGLAVGGFGVTMAASLLRAQVHGIPPFDPVAIGLAVVTLLVCAGAALLVPVRRATRVDPITVLR